MSQIKRLTAEEKKAQTIFGVKSDRKTFNIKDVDLTKRIVTGFFNSINFFDSDWDVSLDGSYSKSINDRGPKSNAVAKFKMLKDHDFTKVVSVPHVLEQKKIGGIEGLYFESKISESTVGTDLLVDYQEGVIDNHSFGFNYGVLTWLESDTDEYKRVFDLLVNPEDAAGKPGLWSVGEYKAFEGSSVAFGANSLTPFLGVKQENKASYHLKLMDRITTIERCVSKGTQSDEHLKELGFQLLQLKQIFTEAMNIEPSKKDTIEPSDTPKFNVSLHL